jgi:hypothetical protein
MWDVPKIFDGYENVDDRLVDVDNLNDEKSVRDYCNFDNLSYLIAIGLRIDIFVVPSLIPFDVNFFLRMTYGYNLKVHIWKDR